MNQTLTKNLIPIVLVVGLLIAGAVYFLNQEKVGTLSPEAAAEKALAFINQTIEEDVTASLLDVNEEAGLYRVYLKIGETEYNSYITKDGKLLFPNAFNLEELIEEQPEANQTEPADLAGFTQCLVDSGAKFYGASWCSWCNKQKELFAEAADSLPYIECSSQDRSILPVCQEVGITSFPTWEFNNELSPGYKTFEQLAELSGCALK